MIRDAELVQAVTEFRDWLLDGKPSENMCFAVCFPLAGWLSFAFKIDAEMWESDLGYTEHVWLKLSDGRCLDPTADQLNKRKRGKPFPPVYLGPVPQWHRQRCWPYDKPQPKSRARCAA